VAVDRLTRTLFLAMKLARERLDQRLAVHGGSLQQWVLMRILAEEPQPSHGELAERMSVSGATVTHHLDRLEAGGLVTRIRSTGDRRVVHVNLTPAGAERLAQLESVADATDAEVRALLTATEAETLHRLLIKLHDRLAEAHQGETLAS
jgi:MarR family transcriptional regulator, transcriptional regulator for hemolysin